MDNKDLYNKIIDYGYEMQHHGLTMARCELGDPKRSQARRKAQDVLDEIIKILEIKP